MSAKTKTKKTAKEGLNKKIIQSTNLLTNEPETEAEEREIMLGGGEEPKNEEAAQDPEEMDERAPAQGEKKTKTEKRKRGSWWHRTNVLYPWLKFVLFAVLAAGMLLGGYEVVKIVHEAAVNDGGVSSLEEGEVKDVKVEETPGEIKDEASVGKPEEQDSEQDGDSEQKAGATQPGQTLPVAVPEGVAGKKMIALTFDDGPSSATTPRLLDILQQKGVKATFFMLGQRMQQVPEVVKRAAAEGHEIASHTPYHNQQTKLGAAGIQAEVATMNQIFTGILGYNPPFTRPPYGSVNDTVRQYMGQPLILWSIDPEDWKDRDAATVRARVVGAAYDGAIALMHDIYATTVDAVAGIIDDLRAQGYEFLTISELAAARGVTLQNGVTYYNFRP